MELNSILDGSMFTPRTLAKTIRQANGTFPILLVTGPRQVGKTTLLEHCATKSRAYVSLDDLSARQLAQEDPALFLQRYPPPVLIDEIQYAPALFPFIKIAVDGFKKCGQFWLTGSQPFHLMRNVSESLAGRVAILRLLGLSLAELKGKASPARPFLPTPETLRKHKAQRGLSLSEVYKTIWTGSYPGVALHPKTNREIFYSSYLQTYIERDVRDLARVGDERSFVKFVRAAAARTGQLLNMADLARDVDIDPKTAKSWLSILETSGLIYLLEPYHTNVTKRLIKSPKLYFLDAGLCCHLTRWTSPEALEAGAMSGALLETFLFSEILKSYWFNGKEGSFYYYRDKDGAEVDLLIEENGVFYPMEFKKTSHPGKEAIRNFGALENLNIPLGHGGVVCLADRWLPLTSKVDIIPISYLV